MTFDEAYALVNPYSLLDMVRLRRLWDAAVAAPEGVILEVGCWRGGASLLMHLASGRPVIACDTFRGVVKAGSCDGMYRGGEHADVDVENVRVMLGNHGCSVMQGVYPDEIRVEQPIALAHIDVDVEASAGGAFTQIWPYVVGGGTVVFDDYFNPYTPGIRRVVDSLGVGELVCYGGVEGQAFVRKGTA